MITILVIMHLVQCEEDLEKTSRALMRRDGERCEQIELFANKIRCLAATLRESKYLVIKRANELPASMASSSPT